MKLFTIVIVLLLTVLADCMGQSKKRIKEQEIETDTIDIFQRFDNIEFKEKNTFWMDKNEVGLTQIHRYVAEKSDAGYSIELTIVFDNWDSIKLERNYSLSSLKTECLLKGVFWEENYNTPTGHIRLVEKTQHQLIFYFDVRALSVARKRFLIYKGERTFRLDY